MFKNENTFFLQKRSYSRLQNLRATCGQKPNADSELELKDSGNVVKDHYRGRVGGASSSMLCFVIPTCQLFVLRLTVDTLYLSDTIQELYVITNL